MDTVSKYCASFAESILIEHLAALEAYVNFAKCYSAKDVDGCKAFNSQMKYRGECVAELRKIFMKCTVFRHNHPFPAWLSQHAPKKPLSRIAVRQPRLAARALARCP